MDEPFTVTRPHEIPFTRFLDFEGRVVRPFPDFAADAGEIKRLYRALVLTRTFDTKAMALQRTGRLGTFASSLGQEAVGVGVGAAMHDDDVFLPFYRDHGTQILRGVSLVELFLYWSGDERGSDFARPRQDFPICVPVATQAPHAAGVALAFKLRGEARAAVCTFGDGATSKGDFYEAANLAGVWKLPVVFVCNNNQWAISVPRERQTAAETLAQKAIAAGFSGEQVDGNDVVAVRHAVGEALRRARAGGGPHLVECLTYRLGDHTSADDASRYRDDETVGQRWKEEPIARLRRYLTENAGWRREDEEALISECAAEVEKATEAYLAHAPQSPLSMFEHLYAELPADFAWQRAAVAAATKADEEGGDA